ncbi:MAG: hypothetical protein AAGA12_11765 [Pseudomonadota bacterium]
MKVVLHLGAHSTDEDHLVSCLRKNETTLAEQGIVVPDPLRYRPIMRKTFQSPKDDVTSPESRELILDAIVDEDEPDRLILSHDSFISVAGNALQGDRIYPSISRKVTRIAQLFEGHELELFLAIKDPGLFIPALFERAPEKDFGKFMEGKDPQKMRWSETIADLHTAMPEAKITVWSNEDAPLIWPELLTALTGHDEFTVLEGQDDFIRTLMMWRGYKRMRAFMEKSPPSSIKQRRMIVGSFLEKFPIYDGMNAIIELPDWSADYVNSLTTLYYQDLEEIEKMDGITYISPFS